MLTQPDRPQGRGRKLGASPVKRAALARQLPLAQPPTLRSEAARATLAGWAPEVLVVVAYGLLLPPEVLQLPRYGCLNIHASLLPRWRGAAPIQRAILAGDARTGVTIMQMDEGLDTGPLLASVPLVISSAHTGGSLEDELSIIGAEALIGVLAELARGTLTPTPQLAEGATYAPRIDKAEARDRLESCGGRDRAAGPGVQSLARRRDPLGRDAAAYPYGANVGDKRIKSR